MNKNSLFLRICAALIGAALLVSLAGCASVPAPPRGVASITPQAAQTSIGGI